MSDRIYIRCCCDPGVILGSLPFPVIRYPVPRHLRLIVNVEVGPLRGRLELQTFTVSAVRNGVIDVEEAIKSESISDSLAEEICVFLEGFEPYHGELVGTAMDGRQSEKVLDTLMTIRRSDPWHSGWNPLSRLHRRVIEALEQMSNFSRVPLTYRPSGSPVLLN